MTDLGPIPSGLPALQGGETRGRAGVVGTVVGVAAAGVAAGVAVERMVLRRTRRRPPTDPYRDEAFGQVGADKYRTVTTDEGLALHVEISGPEDAAVTVIFVHGFCLNSGTFHFQRKALAGLEGVRQVSYDQPGHGRSGRLRKGEYTLDMLGSALGRVIDETAPSGPVVLVGHSMGGMAIMALAEQDPQLFAVSPGGPESRIAGIVLISSSAGDLSDVTFGLPSMVTRFRKQVIPLITGAGPVTTTMVDRARQASTDLAWMLTRRYGFGSVRPSASLVSYVDGMISATSTEVISRYLRTLYTHDRRVNLPAFVDASVLLVVGDEDLITPVEHSEAIAEELPHAELVIVPNGGHVVLLEHNEAVNAVLVPFVRKFLP